MSTELTEQWRNGAIQETYYYVKCPWSNGEVDIRYVHNGVDDWKEIIALVPSYDEWEALKHNCEFTHTRLKGAHQKLEMLEDRLKEAEKVIKFYADAQPLTDEEKQMSAEKYHLVYGLKANDYLEKYGVER